MPTFEEVEDLLDKWSSQAFHMYTECREVAEREGVQFAKTTQDGSEEMALPGMGSLLSPSEVRVIQDSMSWAFSLWTNSGVLPDAHHFSGYARSLGGGTVATICTLSLMSQAVATLALIYSGNESLALHVSESMYPTEEQQSTSPSTSPKNSTEKENTESSRKIGHRITPTPTPPKSASPVTKGTSTGSGRGKRKTGGKKRKTVATRGLKQNKTKKKPK